METIIQGKKDRIHCSKCMIGLFFLLLEISIVIGETLGWINSYLRLDSFLFFIFLVLIISFNKKEQKQKSEMKENE